MKFATCEIVFQGGFSNLYPDQHFIKVAVYPHSQEHRVSACTQLAAGQKNVLHDQLLRGRACGILHLLSKNIPVL